MKWQSFLARFFNVSESEGIVSDDPSGAETFKTLINERQEKKLAALAGALSSEDDLGKVIRAHIHIEHELHELIILAAPSPAHLRPLEKMEFFEKVQLALAFGINAETQPALNAIGNLRNKFAHKLDMKIGEEEANNLIATFRGPSKQRLQALLQELANVPSARKVTSEEVARSKVQAFFIQLFDEVGDERLRLAMEKMRHWTADC